MEKLVNITQILEITLYTLLFLLLIVGGCGIAGVTFGGVLQWSNRRGSKMRANPDPVSHGSEKTSTVPQSALNEPLVASGERKRVALLHISLWVPDQVLEEQSAEQTMECFNAFQHIGRKIAEDLNGMFERNAAHAITLYWPCEPPANVEAGQVPRAAFEMRREISRWNQSRKTDGSKPLSLVMGGDWCLGLVSPRIGMVFAGDAMMRAIQLAHRASSFGVDVLLTEDLNTVVSSDFMSDRIAEANLGAQNARIGCFRLLGYRDTEGNEIQVTSPLLAVSQPETAPHDPAIVVDEDSLLVEAPVKNWMVNTGVTYRRTLCATGNCPSSVLSRSRFRLRVLAGNEGQAREHRAKRDVRRASGRRRFEVLGFRRRQSSWTFD